jgi:hypothetical protein
VRARVWCGGVAEWGIGDLDEKGRGARGLKRAAANGRGVRDFEFWGRCGRDFWWEVSGTEG